jgi:hypothetical protein
MSDEVAKLRTDLEALNLQCQLARDQEIRYALQRSRLEADRVRLLTKLVDAQSSSVQGVQAPATRSAYTVVVSAPPAARPVPMAGNADTNGTAHAIRQRHKPPGLPTVATMVMAVLSRGSTPKQGMAPRDITQVIRREWWQNVRSAHVNSTAWRLATKGRLENNGGRYRLNGHADE